MCGWGAEEEGDMRDMSCLVQPRRTAQRDGAKGWWWVWEKAGWMGGFVSTYKYIHSWVKLKLHT